MAKVTRRVGMQWVSISLLLCCQTITDGTVFLERGQRGIVPCPLIKSSQISRENVEAMYWFYASIRDTSLLISYFFGSVAPQNGIPEGVYDIDSEFSLIIENVTASNEGTYYFGAKLGLNTVKSGQVEVCDRVSPSRPYPTVIGCNQDHNANTCEMRVRHDSTVYNLTCVMEQVKPAVELRWIRLYLGGQRELNVSTTVTPVVLPAFTGSSLRNNTYSTSASVQVTAGDDEELFVCQAMVVVVGNGAHMIVRITKSPPTTATYDEVQSSTNPGTTLFSADEASPTANKPAEKRVGLIVLGVAFSFSFIFNVFACVCIIHLQKKLNECYRTLKMSSQTPPVEMQTSLTSLRTPVATNRTWKRRHYAPANITEI